MFFLPNSILINARKLFDTILLRDALKLFKTQHVPAYRLYSKQDWETALATRTDTCVFPVALHSSLHS